MKKIIALSLLAASLFVLPLTLSACADSTSNNQKDKGTLSVSYSTEKEVAPDTVEFSVSIKAFDKKSMQEASRKNKEISNKIYDYLKANISPANGDYIKTSNFNATPLYVYINNKRTFDKYEVSNNIIVHTKSLNKVSAYIDKVISMGATDVNRLNFTLSDKDAACADLLSKAAKQAKSRANTVAGALGAGVSGYKSVNTSCSLNQRNVAYGYSNMKLMRSAGAVMADNAAESVSTNIEVGNITVYANVDLILYLK